MTSRMDFGRGKIVFKKKAHRPWQPTLLDSPAEDHQSLINVSPKLQDKQIEFLQKQLETTLEIKNKEREGLQVSLSSLENNRVTLGGFIKPNNMLFKTEPVALQKTASIMHELKAKEQEILEITQHLKLTQVEEQVERRLRPSGDGA